MKYSHEIMSDSLMDEMETLWRVHWTEVNTHPDKLELDVDRDLYKTLQSLGKYQTITVRTDENKLVGYIGFFISNHPHYKQDSFAHMDNVFIHKDFRKGTVGVRLFKEAEKLLEGMKVSVITLRAKTSNDLSPIFKYLGYKEQEVVYSKCVKE